MLLSHPHPAMADSTPDDRCSDNHVQKKKKEEPMRFSPRLLDKKKKKLDDPTTTPLLLPTTSEINDKYPIGVFVSEIKEKKKKKRGRPANVRKKSSGQLELGQIWAFSEETDGFPRSYARINSVDPLSSSVCVTLLVPHPVTNEEKQFVEKGLSLACGLFKASRSALRKEISALTHKVSFEIEGKRSPFFKIFPKSGEIWAIYLRWDALKKNFEYMLVEVESDFNEEDGVNVFGLIQVEGSDGVYRRRVHEGFYLVRSFSRRLMSLFSHNLPASRIVEDGETLWKVTGF